MTSLAFRLALAGETMFPPRTPFFYVRGGASRFPCTPLHTLIGQKSADE